MKNFVVSLPSDSATRRSLAGVASGIYRVDLRNADAERVFRASTLSLDSARRFAGKYAICQVVGEGRSHRFHLLADVYGESFAGSFPIEALRSFATFNSVGGEFCAFPYFCERCGRFLSVEEAETHDCTIIRCASCGQPLNAGEVAKGRKICLACAQKTAGAVHGYHGRPNRSAVRFAHPTKRAELCHIGFEKEVDGDGGRNFSPSHCARRISDAVNAPDFYAPFLAFERDGSLHEGVEIITQPLTLVDIYGKRANDIRTIYNIANEEGGIFDKRNGLHAHIDRKFFGGKSNIASIFIEVMIYKFFDFWQHISGRDAGQFSYTRKKENASTLVEASLLADERDRYNAVNTCGNNTIEVRLFGGHIDNADDFGAVADLVNALATWAKKTEETAVVKATPKALARFIKHPRAVLAYLEHIASKTRRATLTDDARKIYDEFVNALTQKANKGDN